MRPTYAEINLGAIGNNVSRLAELIKPAAFCAVVKADGYGHGDVPVASAALAHGATHLAVALVEEGVRLREAGIQAPILLLSEPGPESLPVLEKWDLKPTVYTLGFVEALIDSGIRADAHLKVDTGMHRVGATPDVARDLARQIEKSELVTLEAVWTHFSVADEDPDFTRLQLELFDALGVAAPLSHTANTAGAILFPEARRDMCRIGLGTYGLHPCEETRSVVDLEPAMRVITHVSHVQRLSAGARPSYGRVRELDSDSNMATAPVGYADGFARGLTSGGVALIGGNKYPLAGTVTMDQIVIDVGDDDVQPGDEVVLLGSQGSAEVTADDWAGALNTISYEVVCSIGPRVPRRYQSVVDHL